MTKRPTAVHLMGPTAAGKTHIAVSLVQRLGCQIISVDSAMIYTGMDIGTGKPSADVLLAAPHRLIDVRTPEQTYSAADFRADALLHMAEIEHAGQIPLLVGGTGLYFRALTRGLSRLPSAHAPTRARLAQQGSQLGWDALHERLAGLDPLSAQRIHPNDQQRIQRALEVFELSGQPMSKLLSTDELASPPSDCLTIVIEPADRSRLHKDIERRFDDMLAAGLLEEVIALRSTWTLHKDLPSMRTVGYRQVWDYLEGRWDYATMRDKAVTATRQLARRQLTWLRSMSNVVRFDCHAPDLLERIVNQLSPLWSY